MDEVLYATGFSKTLCWLPLLHWYGELLLELGQEIGHHVDPSQVLHLWGLGGFLHRQSSFVGILVLTANLGAVVNKTSLDLIMLNPFF